AYDDRIGRCLYLRGDIHRLRRTAHIAFAQFARYFGKTGPRPLYGDGFQAGKEVDIVVFAVARIEVVVEYTYRIPLYPDIRPHGKVPVAVGCGQQSRRHDGIAAENSESGEIIPLSPFGLVRKDLAVFE